MWKYNFYHAEKGIRQQQCHLPIYVDASAWNLGLLPDYLPDTHLNLLVFFV